MATFELNRANASQFIRFCLVGVLNTLITLLVIFGLKYFFAMPDLPANMLGYVAGLCNSYIGNGLFTFKSSQFNLKGFLMFLLVFGVAYGVNITATLAALHSGLVNSYHAHLVGMVPYTLVSFLGGKLFVYTAKPEPSEP